VAAKEFQLCLTSKQQTLHFRRSFLKKKAPRRRVLLEEADKMRILWHYDKVEEGAMTVDQKSYLDNVIQPYIHTWIRDRLGIKSR
jgi:hypothetical protein